MRVGKTVSCFLLIVILTASFSLLGQKTKSSVSPQPPSSSTPSGSANAPGNGAIGGGRRDPCWEQAGVPKQAMEQRRSIEQSARTQIQAVCMDTSMTPQQKHEKIRSIHEQTQQQLQGLFTAQQQETLKACQAARRGGQSAPMPHGGGRGPCGEELPAPAPTPTP
jgi:hypothetical protein